MKQESSAINPYNGLFGQQGWICPKCGRVYSPFTQMCLYCKPNNTNTISNTTVSEEKLVMLVDGTIRIAHYDEDYNEDMEYHFWYDCAASESYHRDDVIYWMPIPSFDEILEANRDVLERIKEKGD